MRVSVAGAMLRIPEMMKADDVVHEIEEVAQAVLGDGMYSDLLSEFGVMSESEAAAAAAEDSVPMTVLSQVCSSNWSGLAHY